MGDIFGWKANYLMVVNDPSNQISTFKKKKILKFKHKIDTWKLIVNIKISSGSRTVRSLKIIVYMASFWYMFLL